VTMSRRKTSCRGSVEITERDLKIFQKLNAAGWLTTAQIRDYFFPGKSANAVSKRLRKLMAARYLSLIRHNSTAPALYRLSGQARLMLIEHTGLSRDEITIPNQVPRKISHFIAINDMRFCFERLTEGAEVELLFFFSERELPRYYQHAGRVCDPIVSLLKAYSLMPDAIARIRLTGQRIAREVDLAIEYDAGTEHAAFFGRTKIQQYAKLVAENSERVGDFKVLTFASSIRRIISLMRQAVSHQPPLHLFYFAPMEQLNQKGWESSKIFLDPHDFFISTRQGSHIEVMEKEIQGQSIPRHTLIGLPAASPPRVSPREERE
jgi:hypothetical protein